MTPFRSRTFVLAVVLFPILFFGRLFLSEDRPGGHAGGFHNVVQEASQLFEGSRKNYTSFRKEKGLPASGDIGDAGRFEKIGSLTQETSHFVDDRKQVLDLVTGEKAIIQVERAVGLEGRRVLHLGIGVPAERFDAFVETARAIGRSAGIEIVKNDKTNEYLQLKAKRATLEKARAALEALQTSGGSIDERVNVQGRLTDIENQLQELGVSLGEFDTENELSTVRLSLHEMRSAAAPSWSGRALRAFEWAAWAYLMLGVGVLALTLGLWFGLLVLDRARRFMAEASR